MVSRRPRGENKTFRTAFSVTVYLLAAALVCSLVTQLCTVNYVIVNAQQPGLTDLTDFDFENNIAQIATEFTGSIYIYVGAFYTSEDFSAGNIFTEGVLYDRTDGAQGDYGTLRMELKLPPGQVYAIAAKNPSYAQRLFIDGKEYTAIGIPGDTPETTVPKTARFVEAFMPQGEITEIILHYANFVHADGGGLYPVDVGYVDHIVRNEQLDTIRTMAVATILVTIMLFFFGLFLFFKIYKHLLWFSLVCGCIALRQVSPGILPLLLPELSWYLEIRLSYIDTCCMALFAALYIGSLFPSAVNKWAVRGFLVFCGCCIFFISLAPTTVFTRYPVELSLSYAGFVGYMLLMVLWRSLKGTLSSALSKPEQGLLLLGLIIFAVLSAADIFAHQWSLLLFGLAYQAVGMIVFLFINMLALVMSFSRTEQELDFVRERKQEIQETNRMLERLNRAKTDFLGNISHEMKTPLAVISNCAGVTLMQLRKNSFDENTERNLDDIQHEAVRLGRLVEQLMVVAMEKERQLTLSGTNAETLLRRAAAFCDPICRGHHNQITVECLPAHIPLRVNTDGTFQVLLNLITNANKQLEGGVIALSAEYDVQKNSTVFQVTDNGNGISPALLEHVFERGISDSGGTGLGLAICKEIVQEHGGRMEIESSRSGTTVRFTLPNGKEHPNDE
jgi:signal transduction histidine kinase